MFFVETLSNAQNIMIISDQKFSQIALYFFPPRLKVTS